MKKKSTSPGRTEMRKEYDFTGAVRGKYALAAAPESRPIRVDPDLVRFFPDERAVNQALRKLAEWMRERGAA